MIGLAGCSEQHQIVVAGSRAIELTLYLHRRGYTRAATTANCGQPAGQYDVALVDWRRRTFKTLEVALDWLVKFVSPAGVLVVWIDPQKPSANEKPFAFRWKGSDSSLRTERYMNAVAMSWLGDAR
jgi:hypothetical protein